MFTTPKPLKRDDVAIQIGGKEWAFWRGVVIKRSMDAFSTFSFTGPFDHERPEVRSTYRPFSYQPVTVTVGGYPVITGTMLDPVPSADAAERTISVSGYSKPGVLIDCEAPVESLPLEFNKLKLDAITKSLITPFGLESVFLNDPGAAFESVRLPATEEILPFLVELAHQRGLVISDTPKGKVKFWTAGAIGQKPIARLSDKEQPVVTVTPKFDSQKYFSQITGFSGTKRKNLGDKDTQRNPWLKNVLRPHSFRLDDTEKADAVIATRAKMGRMFGNMASWTLSGLPTWFDPQGDLWEPNTTIALTAPSAMIYRETELVIRSVTLEGEADTKKATLELVLPGAFSGIVPKVLPWDA